MNRISVFVILLAFIFCTHLFSQTPTPATDSVANEDSELPYFWLEDLFYGGEHYMIGCRKTKKNGIYYYEFEVSNTVNQIESKEGFSMIEISPSFKSISIFQKELLQSLDQLHSNSEVVSPEKKDEIEQIAAKVEQDTSHTGLTGKEKTFVQETIKHASDLYSFDVRSLRDSLSSLRNVLETISHPDVNFIDQEVLFAEKFHQVKMEELTKQIKISASEYLFKAYDASLSNQEIAPEVGTLYAERKIKIHSNSSKKNSGSTKYLPDSLKVDSIEIEFEYEQITNIKVIGTVQLQNQKIHVFFQNRVPIAYSTKANVSRDTGSKRNRKISLYPPKKDPRLAQMHIVLGDVFRNEYRLLNQTENYSPKDQVITIKPGDGGKILKKEEVKNILKAKVFTDIIGFGNSTPNGLVQTEVSHRFYLDSRVKQIGSRYWYSGFFNSVMPKITLSKLEEENKYLRLNPVFFDTENEGDSISFSANALDLYRYASWTSGGEANILYLGLPFIQSMLYINGGAYIRHVPMRLPLVDDTLKRITFQNHPPDEDGKFGINILNLFPEATLSVSPHSNFRASFTAKYHLLFHFTEEFQVLSRRTEKEKSDFGVWSFQFLAALRLGEDSNRELFFRSYYNVIPGKPGQNFFQAQLGYAFNIFDRKTPPPPRESLEDL